MERRIVRGMVIYHNRHRSQRAHFTRLKTMLIVLTALAIAIVITLPIALKIVQHIEVIN
jgi:hypothetical protein